MTNEEDLRIITCDKFPVVRPSFPQGPKRHLNILKELGKVKRFGQLLYTIARDLSLLNIRIAWNIGWLSIFTLLIVFDFRAVERSSGALLFLKLRAKNRNARPCQSLSYARITC